MIDTYVSIIEDYSLALFIAITLFLLVANWLKSFVHMGVLFLLAPKFMCRIGRISILGFEFTIDDGKTKYIRHNPLLSVSAYPLFDYKKHMDAKSEDINKADIDFTIISSIATFVISLIIASLLIFASKGTSEVAFVSLLSLGFGLIFHSTVGIAFALIAINKTKTSLSGYTRSVSNRIRNGEIFETLGLLPIEELPYKKVMDFEIIIYYSIYMAYLDSIKNYEKLDEIAGKLAGLVERVTFATGLLGAYYAIIYHYSYRHKEAPKATYFYNKIRQYIEKDPDANAYRIRAHYELTVNGNKELARSFADKASAGVSVFAMGSERVYEEECIRELYNRLALEE